MDFAFKDNIKFNCDISDARYWGYFSICGLLLRYRDLYRSEKGLKPWTNISRTDIAEWIEAKEARWPRLEHEEFRDLAIDGKRFQPFDAEAINQALSPYALIYGAGYGMYMKPTFFLAERTSSRHVSGLTVHTTGLELVRDLLTAPAMLQEDTVFLRLEPLLIMLHYKLSELNARKNSALEDAFAQYGFRNRQLMDETFEKRLRELASKYAEVIVAHEVAEHKESVAGWKDILAASGDRINEHYLRAVKDLIADTSNSGPLKLIIQTKDRGALGLLIAFKEGFQRALYPEIKEAHAKFVLSGDWGLIETARTTGHNRFKAERERILELFRNNSEKEFAKHLREMIAV